MSWLNQELYLPKTLITWLQDWESLTAFYIGRTFSIKLLHTKKIRFLFILFNQSFQHSNQYFYLIKEGNPQPAVFFEWFYKCGSIVNKFMSEQWSDGCIMGFCSKERSEQILRATYSPTMMIRFSDLVIGYLKISCRLPDQRIVHYETEADKMPLGTSIGKYFH